ncbi:MAG: acyltransferase [Ferruginibacter sp.]|nr:acyltransferase [Ferruginibacter sp.]
MKRFIQKIFGLRTDVGIHFYVADFFFRKILRQNAGTSWAVHYTSTIVCPQNIVRGKGVYPGDSPNNYIEAYNGIEIGDYTNIGPGVGILSANHNKINNAAHDFAPPVKIGKYCWIGMQAVILPGVTLGDFTIVGAGSVVTKSFPDGHCVIAGNPAAIINTLDSDECKRFASNHTR